MILNYATLTDPMFPSAPKIGNVVSTTPASLPFLTGSKENPPIPM
jgi:hypothetical protein